MNDSPWIVAVEGPCCAGKTTLIDALVEQLTDLHVRRVPCYADHVGGGRFLPREVPATLAEDAQGLEVLIGLDRGRMDNLPSGPADVVLLDRSVHTFLAHRSGVEAVTGLQCVDPARHRLQISSVVTWPSLVLYLDVAQSTIRARNRGKFPPRSILINAEFNAAVRSYFAGVATAPPPAVAWLDASTRARQVAADAMTALLSHVERGTG